MAVLIYFLDGAHQQSQLKSSNKNGWVWKDEIINIGLEIILAVLGEIAKRYMYGEGRNNSRKTRSSNSFPHWI